MSDTPKSPEVEDLIRYDILAQEALRSVVKKVLQEVARTGLPGEHHFYITFDTRHAGVRMSSRMLDKYPEEMTIVVQHQFWDLEATDHGFSIGLSFDNVPEALSIPFSAVRGFFDPSVQFGLQFEIYENLQEQGDDASDADTDALPSPSLAKKITDATDSGGTDDKDGKSGGEEASADVVSLDAFRKK